MRVIGYTYEADTHCVGCTKDRFDKGGFKIDKTVASANGIDENEVSYGATDRDGNLVHPIFSTDELQLDDESNPMACVCGTCGGIIRAP